MKNILNLYLIIFCLFFVAGCSLDDDAATVKLTIIKSDLDMKASGGTELSNLQQLELSRLR